MGNIQKSHKPIGRHDLVKRYVQAEEVAEMIHILASDVASKNGGKVFCGRRTEHTRRP